MKASKLTVTAVVGVGAGVIALAGCGFHPFVPASALGGSHQRQLSPTSRHATLGVDIQANTDFTLRQTLIYGKRLMPYVSRRLHATSVGIVWNLCDPSFTSDKVSRCKQSLTPADVRSLVAQARADRLTVQLRPIIRVGPPTLWNYPKKSYEGRIRPRNQRAWLASLLGAEKPYLAVLKDGGQMVVGTELEGLTASAKWDRFLQGAARDCAHKCSLTLALQHVDYAAGVLTSVVRDPGVDWYPVLKLSAKASQRRVTAAFESGLRDVPPQLLRRTTLDELGIRASVGAYHHPASWNLGGRADATVQVRYFIAACATVKHYGMGGLYYYEIPLNDNPAHPFNFPAFFVANAGSKAIASCAQMLHVR